MKENNGYKALKERISNMKYYITINGYADVEVANRDLAVFIGKALKTKHPENEIKVFKDGELVLEVK